ncbi:hypothetical protein AMJ80_09055 [bacterium SM23_31]|nr:MAG: hypothetical protein AMJ80_09055 [bacterium SM23_31]
MPAKQISLENRKLAPHKSSINPDFRSKTVLVENTWDYVHMWLTRKQKKKALFYWEQASHFHRATMQLPNTSSPLTGYYCFLNATKALLSVRNIPVSERHGVEGESTSQNAHLSNEVVTFHEGGVLASLCSYFGEPTEGAQYTLKDIFYNLVYIHRSYNLTFSSQPELFIPLTRPKFVKKTNSNEAWFCAEISDDRYTNQHTINKLPDGFERDLSPDYLSKSQFVIRRTNRFAWRQGNREKAGNIQRLKNYHKSLRKHIQYIHGASRLWYIKRRHGPEGIIDRCSITLTYAAMHRLSELSRYNPMLLAKHMNAQHNWLISEFIATACTQFIDEISSEITGKEFMIPGRRSVK